MPKPDFRRLRTALMCEGEPDRVPLLELIICREVMSAFLGRPVEGWRDVVDFYAAAGYDAVNVCPFINRNPAGIMPKEGARVSKIKHNVYADDNVEVYWSPEGAGAVTTMDEFERYRFPEPEETDYSAFDEVVPLLPEGMKIVAHHGDIFTRAWELMGFETFCFSLTEQPQLVGAVFERIGHVVFECFRTMMDMPQVGAVWYSDDIAYAPHMFLSPDAFREYLFPWLKRIGDLCRERDLPFIYHSDGNLWPVMSDLIDDIGFNALQPIEPKAMDIRELKAKVGDRVCLVGNVDLEYTLTRGSPEEVAALTRALIRDIGPGGGYCVGSSNTIPTYVPEPNFRAMVETTLEYGRYPIV